MRDVNAILIAKNFQTIKSKFLARVPVGRPDECWEWQGARTASNYGVFSDGRNMEGAHRFAYVLANGPLPELPGFHGACVLHKCDNPPCCNPAHLFVGTTKDNMQDKSKKGRAPHGEDHHLSRITDEQAAAIRLDPRTYDEIQAEYGLNQGSISLIKNGKLWRHAGDPTVRAPKAYVRGEQSKVAKLTESAVRDIRLSTETPTTLADRYNINLSTVNRIRRRVSWRHVE